MAVTEHLLFANVPEDLSIPEYFRLELRALIHELSTKTWRPDLEGDRIRATIHPMRFKTAALAARRVWRLYNEFEEYSFSGFVPSGRANDGRRCRRSSIYPGRRGREIKDL
jgi:hypothetical protein